MPITCQSWHISESKGNMEDVFRRLLAASDTWISNLRKTPLAKSKPLSPEVIEMLVSPTSVEFSRDS